MARGVTLAALWLHEPQPISNHPVGFGLRRPAGRYRLGGSAFSSPGCWSCGDKDGFLTRVWEFILPRCGGTSALARGITLAARWLTQPQPISNHPVGLGIPHPAGRYRPGGSVFSSPGCWSCRYGRFFEPGIGIYPPRVRRDLSVGPRGNSRRALAP